ncbi:MAG: DNA-deoxyinosine glycosylase [Acutalibacteraceae bacterium]
MSKLSHPIPPLYDENSEILILGSFPSVKSREVMFFYGHKQNRFWRVMARLLNSETPETVESKTRLILENHFALWDVIGSCEIEGSADSTIKSVTPNDLSVILNNAPIKRIFVNGKKAFELYKKYIEPETGITACVLPSTSPANASFSEDRLVSEWGRAIFGENSICEQTDKENTEDTV